MNLLADTQARLGKVRGSGLSLREIASEPEVPYEWLKKFAKGRIPDPSVNRIEALHARLCSLQSSGSRGCRGAA